MKNRKKKNKLKPNHGLGQNPPKRKLNSKPTEEKNENFERLIEAKRKKGKIDQAEQNR